MSRKFGEWIRVLDEEVIQGEFGYERGEFTVYPSGWRHMFIEGLTPRQAWQRAMDAHKAYRDEEDAKKLANYQRILVEEGRAPPPRMEG